jgi:disulfide oxidoreductase YuzD
MILNGGIKSCCSVTPTEVVEKTVRGWLPAEVDFRVIDVTKETYEIKGQAQFAEKYFRDQVYPLLFINDTLAMIGGVPNRKELLGMVDGKVPFGITEKDIVEAAKGMGLHTED